ncbi:MAG: DUF881 domain-containing protein [Tuberibacillus sp.]
MNKKNRAALAFIALFLGFMIALQFQTAKTPKNRDTRDIWQLQDDLTKEQKKHIQLNQELDGSLELLHKYESDSTKTKANAIKEELAEQKRVAGLTDVTGKGLTITIRSLEGTTLEDSSYEDVTADLIRQLINELNFYGATDIAIAGERVINISPIRMVHNDLYINDRKVPGVPFSVQAILPKPEDGKNGLSVSEVADNYARVGLVLNIQVEDNLTLPPYDQSIDLHYMKPTEGGS